MTVAKLIATAAQIKEYGSSKFVEFIKFSSWEITISGNILFKQSNFEAALAKYDKVFFEFIY